MDFEGWWLIRRRRKNEEEEEGSGSVRKDTVGVEGCEDEDVGVREICVNERVCLLFTVSSIVEKFESEVKGSVGWVL